MGAAAAVIMMKERQIVEVFERAGATSPSRGRSADELGVDAGGIGWRRLHERAIVRESSPGSGLYYLDVEVWQATRRMRHRVLLVLLIVVLAIGVVLSTGVYAGLSAR